MPWGWRQRTEMTSSLFDVNVYVNHKYAPSASSCTTTFTLITTNIICAILLIRQIFRIPSPLPPPRPSSPSIISMNQMNHSERSSRHSLDWSLPSTANHPTFRILMRAVYVAVTLLSYRSYYVQHMIALQISSAF